ncbi:MAG: S-methyl-5-thioribose-1-phosphate isomerase [Firmicutes bacterium]|nr:S-methyl-5-thioribose-1-phosphate isomerase [Bacillota bacterium]
MKALEWTGDGLRLLDQTRLPQAQVWLTCRQVEDVAEAIRQMRVRGAPAIAVAAAFGVALAARQAAAKGATVAAVRAAAAAASQELAQTRPTAVQLFAVLAALRQVWEDPGVDSGQALAEHITRAAERLAKTDSQVNRKIGDWGAQLFDRPVRILTHCNTGALATVEYGTALGVIRSLHREGKLAGVWVDETRPFLQGARLTAFELLQENIPFHLITDSTAAVLMRAGQVDAVVVGADRIAVNGDTANKIGTYGLAVLCRYHGIPFYVAAPMATIDPSAANGQAIPIEERAAHEVTEVLGQPIAPAGTPVWHPAFDVTPADLITALITEHGVLARPNERRIRDWLALQDAAAAGAGEGDV